MRNLTRKSRLMLLAAVLGLGMGGAAATFVAPLEAAIAPPAGGLGHGHIEPNGVYFCHCSGSACKPCG